MKVQVKTDFEFKGSRTYVHSSTLMEALCRIIHAHFHGEEDWDRPSVDAQFHQEIIANGVMTVSEDRESLGGIKSPPAVMRFYDGIKSISAVFVPDPGAKVVRRIDPEYRIEGIALEEEFSGTCRIDGSSRVALVENVIEANKRIHLKTLEGRGTALKVVNLYVKRFPVGLPGSRGGEKLLLKIENQGVRRRGDSVATLNTLKFPEIQGDAFEMCFVVYGL